MKSSSRRFLSLGISRAATKASIVNDEVVLQESQWMEGRTKYKGCSQVSHLDLKHLGEELWWLWDEIVINLLNLHSIRSLPRKFKRFSQKQTVLSLFTSRIVVFENKQLVTYYLAREDDAYLPIACNSALARLCVFLAPLHLLTFLSSFYSCPLSHYSQVSESRTFSSSPFS